ncbi:MAG: hypothetical protein QGG54_02120 [Gammaproteobacteria bacterium]|nr:hypothetical protein [Gammaproteobacteria bacterium]
MKSPVKISNPLRSASFCLIASLLLVSGYANADAIRDANRLLRVTNMGKHFDSLALRQTRGILRTYASIVSMSAEITLPEQIKNSIAACYVDVYAWEKFQPGIARILADNLSQKQLRLLTDFYLNRGLPPMEIQTFKDTIAMAEHIQYLAAEYMYRNSASCVEHDAALILGYLADRRESSEKLFHAQ